MKQKNDKKIAIYSRKSKFTGKGESIENQIEICKSYIKTRCENISEENILVYEDEGFSGKNTKRPQFQELLKQVRDNNIKMIVCYRLDRISRNVGDFARLKEEFDYYNVEFVSVRDNFDTTTPTGIAMMMMVSVFAQLERDTIAERIRDNMHELAKSGRWLGGITPTGYKSTELVGSVTVDGKTRKAFKLEIIPEEAEIVKLAFDKFIETGSLTKTEVYFRQKHILTKNGKDFTRFAIKNILQNPVYLIADKNAYNYFESKNVDVYSEPKEFDGIHGIMAYNKTIQKTGRRNEIRDITEWIVAVGKHKGLIESKKWIIVQDKLELNRSKSYRKPKVGTSLLSGILYCGNCRAYMRPRLTTRLNADGEKIYSYLCETKDKTRMQDCKMKNPNGNELDKAVCEHIKSLAENKSEFLKGLEKAKKSLELNSTDYDKQITSLRKNIKEYESQIKSLINALSKSEEDIAYDYISQEINALHSKIETANAQIKELEAVNNQGVLSDDEFDIMKDMLKSFAKSFDTMSVEQKHTALRSFIKKVIWDGENVHIILFGADENEVDLSGDEIKLNEPNGEHSE